MFLIENSCLEFQFPSNGKADPKFIPSNLRLYDWDWFQFPSNGKADPKKKIMSYAPNNLELMFQFPSNGKADPKYDLLKLKLKTPLKCFNSLQTGKQIQSLFYLQLHRKWNFLFQFPSNGKADPKSRPRNHVR